MHAFRPLLKRFPCPLSPRAACRRRRRPLQEIEMTATEQSGGSKQRPLVKLLSYALLSHILLGVLWPQTGPLALRPRGTAAPGALPAEPCAEDLFAPMAGGRTLGGEGYG